MPRAKSNKYLQIAQSHLDLHGLTLAEAELAVPQWLAVCRKKNYRLVRLIVGKGLSSESGRPVLRPWAEDYLSFHEYRWRWAKISDGGEGALDIFL